MTIGWSRGPSGWEWCAELVDPLLSSAATGHFQYMTQSAWDETEIKLEYKDLDTRSS